MLWHTVFVWGNEMRIIANLFLLILMLLAIAFALLNASPVKINYYFIEQTIPLSLLLVLTLVIGLFIGFFSGFLMFLRQKRINYQLKKRIKLADQEIENLRKIPLSDLR